MRKYKQVHRKEITYDLAKWRKIEECASSVMLKTGTFIKRMSLEGKIIYFDMREISDVMKALRIIGANINQIARKANVFILKSRIYFPTVRSEIISPEHRNSSLSIRRDKRCIPRSFTSCRQRIGLAHYFNLQQVLFAQNAKSNTQMNWFLWRFFQITIILTAIAAVIYKDNYR